MKRGGRLVPNECYQSEKQEFAKSRDEAELIRKQIQTSTLKKFFTMSKKRRIENDNETSAILDIASVEITQPVIPDSAMQKTNDAIKPDQRKGEADTMIACSSKAIEMEAQASDVMEAQSSGVTIESVIEHLQRKELQHSQILECMEQLSINYEKPTKVESKETTDQKLLEKKDFIDKNVDNVLVNANSIEEVIEEVMGD